MTSNGVVGIMVLLLCWLSFLENWAENVMEVHILCDTRAIWW